MAGTNAETVEAKAPRTIADTNFILDIGSVRVRKNIARGSVGAVKTDLHVDVEIIGMMMASVI